MAADRNRMGGRRGTHESRATHPCIGGCWRAQVIRVTAFQIAREGWIVRVLTLSVLLASSIAAATGAATGAFAQSMNQDDLKWINQCIRDNRDEGASASVVRAYCICMNEKMDSNETRSITQWEKANPAARRACEKEAGWK
jgi:hypothetical protein